MSQHPTDADPLVGEVRLRVPLPILIPVAAIVLIAAATIGFSRILLAVPKEAATVLAIVMALNVLGACAVIALRPGMSQTAIVELIIVVCYPLIIGIVLAQLNIGAGEETAAASEAPPAAAEGTIVAEGAQFNTDTIELKAGEEASIPFENRDSIEHNIAIYENAQDAEAQKNAIFDGDLISATSTTYTFPAPEKGEYPFQCDLHPTTMVGTVVVE